jgi:hypothetical protein
VDVMEDTQFLVVIQQRHGLLSVGGQAMADSLRLIILALDQRLTGHVIHTLLLGWVERTVVDPSTGRVNQSIWWWAGHRGNSKCTRVSACVCDFVCVC